MRLFSCKSYVRKGLVSERAKRLIPLLQSLEDDREGQHEGERRIEETQRAIAFVPSRRMVILGVDQERHAAHFLRDRHAAFGGAQEQPSAEPASLHAAIDGESAETVDGDFIATETARQDGGRAAEFDRGGAQRVEAEDAGGRIARRGDEAFRAAALMVLARVAFQIGIETVLAAIEGVAVVVLAERRFPPKGGPSFKHEARLGGADEARGRVWRIFEEIEHAQGVTFRQAQPSDR